MGHVKRPYAVLGFESVHDALAAEDALRADGIPVVTIPSPRELGELCGVALRLDPMDETKAVEAIGRAGIAIMATAAIDDL